MQEKEAQKPNIPAELKELLTKLKDSGELESYLPQTQEPTLCELLARDFKGNIKQPMRTVSWSYNGMRH